MLFTSPRLIQFFQEELGYPKDLIHMIQEDFFETFLLYLETETNLYLDEHNLEEEYQKLADAQKSDPIGLQADLTQAFIDLYIKYPNIKSKVDEKMSYFTRMFTSNIKRRMTPEQLEKMDTILEEEIAKYAKVRKQLTQEI